MRTILQLLTNKSVRIEIMLQQVSTLILKEHKFIAHNLILKDNKKDAWVFSW
jgi:hypothetical protein